MDFKEPRTVSWKELIWSNFFPNSGNEFGSAFQSIPDRCSSSLCTKMKTPESSEQLVLLLDGSDFASSGELDLPSPGPRAALSCISSAEWPHRYLKTVICLCLVCTPVQLSQIPQPFFMLRIFCYLPPTPEKKTTPYAT